MTGAVLAVMRTTSPSTRLLLRKRTLRSSPSSQSMRSTRCLPSDTRPMPRTSGRMSFGPSRCKMSMPLQDARSRRSMTACGPPLETTSSRHSGNMFILEDSSLLVSALEEDLPLSAMSTSGPLNSSIMLKSLPSDLQEWEIESGLTGSTELPNLPESILEKILLPSYQDV